MDHAHKWLKAEVEMQRVHSESQAKSCFECVNITGKNGWPWCKFFDKPTSGAVNNCDQYRRHG